MQAHVEEAVVQAAHASPRRADRALGSRRPSRSRSSTGSYGRVLGRELQLVEAAVEAAGLAQQLLVAADLADLAAVEHHDAVGVRARWRAGGR